MAGILNERMGTPIAVVVLTLNEERNLPACLDSVAGWAAQIFVVDSGSTDRTQQMAQTRGAVTATHAFETHARQWRWALANLPLHCEWVLALDADQRATAELRTAIDRLVSQPGAIEGAFVCRRQIFRGKWIRFGGYYPKYLLKLFRRSCVSIDDADLVDHHFSVAGPTTKLAGDLIEDNQNEASISVWTEKHIRYAALQARQERLHDGPRLSVSAVFGPPDRRTAYLKQLWRGLPLYVRPCLYVVYRYVLRLGFLDGKQGFIFHVLQGFWYRLLVDINLDELEQGRAATEVLTSPTPARPDTGKAVGPSAGSGAGGASRGPDLRPWQP
jgi:glycosyltransferase involved in cell wall biosynthesis